MIQLLGTEAACGTSSGAASNFGGTSAVRLINTTTAVHLVTLEEAGGTDIGTFTLGGGASEVIRKLPTDKIFAANAGVLGVAVGFTY
tara:strand:+ start:563 stop:823 length:261 start_codon:yes stop_codon:yes gene_type:complete